MAGILRRLWSIPDPILGMSLRKHATGTSHLAAGGGRSPLQAYVGLMPRIGLGSTKDVLEYQPISGRGHKTNDYWTHSGRRAAGILDTGNGRCMC